MGRQDAEHAKRDAKEPSRELDRLAHEVIGAAIEVHRNLGPGFLEMIYETALVLELEDRNIRFRRQVPIEVIYKARVIGESRLDLLVEDELVVEINTWIRSCRSIERKSSRTCERERSSLVC
jgi:GxxExxY protein